MIRPPIPDGDPTVDVLRDALDAMDEHVTLLDPQGRLLHVNRAWRAFAVENGWGGDAWPGMDYVAATESADDPEAHRIAAGLRAVLAGERASFHAEYPCHSPDELRWFDVRAMPLPVEGVGALIVHTDITQRRLAERALEHAASHDEVTGLANRRLLQRRLEELLVAQPVGVLVLRLHGDDPTAPPQLGAARDEILRETAALVERLFPEPAVTGRYGLDQFVALLPGHDAAALGRLAVTVSAGWHARLGERPGLDVSVGRTIAQPGDNARKTLARAALAARPARRLADRAVGLDGRTGPAADHPAGLDGRTGRTADRTAGLNSPTGRTADHAVGLDGLAGRPPRDGAAPPLDEPVRVAAHAPLGSRSQTAGPDPAAA